MAVAVRVRRERRLSPAGAFATCCRPGIPCLPCAAAHRRLPFLRPATCTARKVGRCFIAPALIAGTPPRCLSPFVIRWGRDASSDLLRRSARCTRCGGKGAMIVMRGGGLWSPDDLPLKRHVEGEADGGRGGHEGCENLCVGRDCVGGHWPHSGDGERAPLPSSAVTSESTMADAYG
jgi:hypothetical protein